MPLPKIDVPIYETKLISNNKTIKFRPFLVKEQKLFLMASQAEEMNDAIQVVKQVLNNCILTEDVDVEQLATFDIEYLFLQLRAKSVGEVVNLRYTCNNNVTDENGNTKKCGGIVKFDLNIQEVKPILTEEHSNKIEISPKLGIVMKYPTFKTFDETVDDDVLNIIVNCIDYIYDDNEIYYSKDHTKEELKDFIENMQKEDFIKFDKFFETMPKLKKELDFKCPKCAYEEKIAVEGIQSFFD